MQENSISLSNLFDGWDGYQMSIIHALQPLAREQLIWRPAPKLRSVGELAGHIAFARVRWFARMPAPGSLQLRQKVEEVGSEAVIAEDRDAIIHWLEITWQMIADTLKQWTIQDLSRTYRNAYGGKIYSVSYQWTIWRIKTHDVHHGGEVALMLGIQGIEVPELGDLFGHLTMPPLAEQF